MSSKERHNDPVFIFLHCLSILMRGEWCDIMPYISSVMVVCFFFKLNIYWIGWVSLGVVVLISVSRSVFFLRYCIRFHNITVKSVDLRCVWQLKYVKSRSVCTYHLHGEVLSTVSFRLIPFNLPFFFLCCQFGVIFTKLRRSMTFLQKQK